MDHPPTPTPPKIVTTETLLALRRAARAQGRSVVQCHGCFDLVHPGHVRHLQFAAQQGDLLIVSITSDAGVNKGDGRPLFNASLRAENLAALDCVDYVVISHEPTAVALLDKLRPDIYVKGREYESNNDPRFIAERETVERHGGRVVFSSGDIVFSSTALIRAIDAADSHDGAAVDPAHQRLRQLLTRSELSGAAISTTLEAFAGRRVLVVGEAIVDTYVVCDRPAVASESPVLSLRPLERVSFDGGAAVVARHIAALGGKPVLVTALPRSTHAEAMVERLAADGVEVRSVDIEGQILEKQRFLVGQQKVMKLDLVRPITLDATQRNELLTAAASSADECQAGIITDFGLNLFSPRSMADLIANLRPRLSVIAGDVSGQRSSLTQMVGVDLLCPTEHELRASLHEYDASLNAAVWALMQTTRCARVLATLGEEGMIAFERLPEEDTADRWAARVRADHIPALAAQAVDPLGCGDALLASATLGLLTGAPFITAAFLGALAAGVHAERFGNDAVSTNDLHHAAERIAGARLAVRTAIRRPRRVG